MSLRQHLLTLLVLRAICIVWPYSTLKVRSGLVSLVQVKISLGSVT
jgi:hypothetical protein